MNRNQLNLFVDALAGICFILSLASGLIREWHRWHVLASWLLCLLVLIHLAMHYKWLAHSVKSLFQNKQSKVTQSQEQ